MTTDASYCRCGHRRYFHRLACTAFDVAGGRKRRLTPCPCKVFSGEVAS